MKIAILKGDAQFLYDARQDRNKVRIARFKVVNLQIAKFIYKL
jgi:hypothetical protein